MVREKEARSCHELENNGASETKDIEEANASDPRRPPADIFLKYSLRQEVSGPLSRLHLWNQLLRICAGAILEIPGGGRRLDRIFGLIQSCRFRFMTFESRTGYEASSHSAVQHAVRAGTLRGMERLGNKRHTWFIYESRDRRGVKIIERPKWHRSHIHGGKITGVFLEIYSAFVRPKRQHPFSKCEKFIAM